MLRLLICICLPVLCLLLAGGARAADPPASVPAGWTRTGDELWDAYVAALEAQMELPLPPNGRVPAPVLAAETLAAWQPRFGGDPRYWQLCYWSATISNLQHPKPEAHPLDYVRQGLNAGASDEAALWLVFCDESRKLDGIEERIESGTESPAVKAWLANANLPDMPYDALQKLRDDLSAALTSEIPGESAPWYNRAFHRFELGDWTNGLAYMARGNDAPHNRKPVPFPLSFVRARLASGEPVGSEAVAGIVLEQAAQFPGYPLYLAPLDHTRELLVRLGAGAQLGEADVWHRWLMRTALMEGTDNVDRLAMVTLSGILTQSLVDEQGESLEGAQQGDLMDLQSQIHAVSGLCQYDVDNALDLDAYLDARLEQGGGEFLAQVQEDTLYPPSAAELAAPGKWPQSGPAEPYISYLRHALYAWQYADAMRSAHSPELAEARSRFSRGLKFDFTTLRWTEQAPAAVQ